MGSAFVWIEHSYAFKDVIIRKQNRTEKLKRYEDLDHILVVSILQVE